MSRMIRQGYAPQRRLAWGPRSGKRSGAKIRLFIGLAVALFAVISFFGSSQFNKFTGEKQYIGLSTQQEIALGLQAAPEMIAQHGGLHPDPRLQEQLDRVGARLVLNTAVRETGWQFEFHLLTDPRTVNAFALPGGQVFITTALYERLSTEGQLAGVLGHEVGHVVARHSAQRVAKSKLTQGLTGAVAVATESAGSAQAAVMIGQLVNMQYGRGDELESDRLGVRIMAEAGYDPRALIEVMNVLEASAGGARQPEFFSTHPNPENRRERILEAIAELFPEDVPPDFVP